MQESREQIAASQSKMEEINRDASARSRAINNIEGLEREVVLFAHDADITFIGDSVLLSVSDQLVTIFGRAVVEGAVSRQLHQTTEVIADLKKREQLHDTVVVFLGSNGTFTRTQMESFIEEIGTSKDLFLLTTNVPRIWKDSVNEQLELAEAGIQCPSSGLECLQQQAWRLASGGPSPSESDWRATISPFCGRANL